MTTLTHSAAPTAEAAAAENKKLRHVVESQQFTVPLLLELVR